MTLYPETLEDLGFITSVGSWVTLPFPVPTDKANTKNYIRPCIEIEGKENILNKKVLFIIV